MSHLSDVSLPEPGNVASVLRDVVSAGWDTGGLTTGASAAVAGLSGTPLAALVVLMAKGYGQEKGVELTARADQKLDDIVDTLDDEERAQRCLGLVLQGVRTLLPQGEQYQHPSLQTAENEPKNLAALFQTYQDDPEHRREMEKAVERVLAGEVDQETFGPEHEDFVDYLRDAFRVGTRDEALAMFLDFREILQAREIHETLAAVEEIEFDEEALSEKLEDTERRLADRLDAILEADLENEGFHRLSPYYFDQRKPQAEPATCWRVGFQPADVQAGYALEREEAVTDGDSLKEGATTRRRVTAHLVDRLQESEDIVITGLPGSGKSTILQSVACQWYEYQHGTVFYRRHGQAVSAFEDTGTLAERIDDAEGHVLVVVEDAVREDANTIFETLRRYENDPAVSFLFDARVSEWREDDLMTTDALHTVPILLVPLPEYQPPET